jgi:N utilization substance protein A
MRSVLETLGIDLDQPLTPEPTVVTATFTSTTPDVAVVITHDGVEAIVPISEWYPNRRWAVGDTYQMLLLDQAPRPIASAVRPELVEAVYDGLVPELVAGTVRIMSVARAAGLRTKIAVAATASTTADPVAAMIGRDANRVRLVGALLYERIDVIAWHPDPEVYLANALAPAKVTRVEITETGARAFTPSHQMSAAVGHQGLNSQLAGQLLGIPVTVVAEG